MQEAGEKLSGVPEPAVRRWLQPVIWFLQIEAASGALLLSCAVFALVMANSVYGEAYIQFWQTPVNLVVGSFHLLHAPHDNLLAVINDGLMTIFFFVVGLEIKREIIGGELREWKKAALPILAALGGVVVPIALYRLQIRSGPGEPGWGIPMATDIAFVVGVLALFGRRAPFGLRIFLLSLAIADDIAGILVIALAYTQSIHAEMLGWAAFGFALTFFFNRIGVRQVPVYFATGVGIWYCFLEAGVHPTVGGVLLGLSTPASAWVGDSSLRQVVGDALRRLSSNQLGTTHVRRTAMRQLAFTSREAVSPLERLEVAIHPWVSFIIMPLFALANAGVKLDPARFSDPITLAVATGLFFGKPIGIVTASWLAVRTGIARLPAGVSWRILLGAGFLGGIGFTMSLFLANLSLPPESRDAGKLGTMMGSTASVFVGSVLMLIFLPRPGSAVAVPAPREREVHADAR